MEEHTGSSFVNSCVKMPVDPYSRQPTPSYERPRNVKSSSPVKSDKCSKTDDNSTPNDFLIDTCSPVNVHDFLDFLVSIPDYQDVHHLSNEQFRQKLDYLKRKQTMLLTNLREYLNGKEDDDTVVNKLVSGKGRKMKNRGSKKLSKKEKKQSINKEKQCSVGDDNKLKLKGKRFNMERSGTNSPILFTRGNFRYLMKDQDILSYSHKTTKTEKTLQNKDILLSVRSWSDGSEESKIDHCTESDPELSTFNLQRKSADKYMFNVENQLKKATSYCTRKKSGRKKRRARNIPKTSKLPLYDKLLAEKEERSRIIREESALNLLSQVRPFKLECEQRAWRSCSRSTPEQKTRKISSSLRFKAKPVPKNLFNSDVYDKMIEDEYFRHLQKKIRAIELLKSSSLPPSMARRQKIRSSSMNSHDNLSKDSTSEKSQKTRRPLYTSSSSSDRPKSVMMMRTNSGINLAAVLRCQASREKIEQEIQEQIEEKERIQHEKLRQAMVARKPAWKALRIAARYDHAKDLNYRTKLRRNEAREQAEQHRIQMDLMLDRVTQIPTLFERYSQNFQLYSQYISEIQKAKTEKNVKKLGSSSAESYASLRSSSTSSLRLNTASSISSSGTILSLSNHSSNSSNTSRKNHVSKEEMNNSKKKTDRGSLKVSINENAELIEDKFETNSVVINETNTNNELENKDDEHENKKD